MAKTDLTVCTTPVENTYRTTWIIENFPVLMQKAAGKSLAHPVLHIPLSPLEKKNISDWKIKCWPNCRGGKAWTNEL